MTVTCPTCAAVYRSIVAKPGQKVRCSHCDASWRVAAADDPAADPTVIDAEATSEKAQPPSYEELYETNARPTAAMPPQARGARAPAPVLFAVGGLALAMALLGGKNIIVKTAPQTAALYSAAGFPVNARGLAFSNVTSMIVDASGQKMLGVEGQIANLREARNDVPQLEITVRDAKGRTIYSWTTGAPKSKLDGFETISFRARLAAPPEEGHDVLVAFAKPTRVASR